MKIIIDGYNLMPYLDTGKKNLQERREILCGLINEFLEVNTGSAVIVFDGHSNPSAYRGHEKKGKVKVVFSANGENADDVIMEMIKKRDGRAREYMVITTDRRIKDFAAQNSVKTMDSGQFAEYLEE